MSAVVDKYARSCEYIYYIFVIGCLVAQCVLMFIVSKFGIIK